jgi:AcrR family transcriptional regulator
MWKIALQAGVNQSLLHYYYGSKENLMLEVLQYVNARLLDRQRAMYQEVRSFGAIWGRRPWIISRKMCDLDMSGRSGS